MFFIQEVNMKKIFAVLLAAMVIFASGCQSQDTGKIDYSDSSFSLSPKPLAAKSVKQIPIWRNLNQISTKTATIQTPPTPFCLWVFIRRLTLHLKQWVYKLLPPYSTMNTATIFHRFWVELP